MKTDEFPVQLESNYLALARAIDAAEPELQTHFLAKLALLLAQEIGDPDVINSAINLALQDLDGPAPRIGGEPVGASIRC